MQLRPNDLLLALKLAVLPEVHPEGELRGEALHPLYKAAPLSARRDLALHELLAFLDAVRAGRARERNLAVLELERRIALAPL